MKIILKYLKPATVLLAMSMAFGLASCDKDKNEEYYSYFAGKNSTLESLEVDNKGMIGDTFSRQMTYDFYTNAGEWVIEYDYSKCYFPNNSWMDSWPKEGSGEGRFTITIDPNDKEGEPRSAKINIVTKTGKVLKTIDVVQAASTSVMLRLTATFQSVINMEATDTADRRVGILANVFWDAYVVDEPDWVHLSIDKDVRENFTFNLDENTGDARSATIVIYQISNDRNTTTVTINQAAAAVAPTPDNPETPATPTPPVGE